MWLQDARQRILMLEQEQAGEARAHHRWPASTRAHRHRSTRVPLWDEPATIKTVQPSSSNVSRAAGCGRLAVKVLPHSKATGTPRATESDARASVAASNRARSL